ncbi:MAG: hypothetical protein E6G34_11270 [Actinobacteria bacterium]|nr:MAG: hypothetical protein E6G34_11270 [Actinomycetota bacterium]
MTRRTSSSRPATPEQLAYLKSLALQTGTSFTLPRTRGLASLEIDRLKVLEATRGRHVEAPWEADPRERPYATALHPSEVSGFGSQARWRSDHAAIVRTAARRRAGELTELARYEVEGERRVLYGQRIAGCVTITDRPANGSGRSYLVDRGLEKDGYAALKALVCDYTDLAQRLQRIPMARSSLRRELEP